jgi:hypothetical protein
LPDYAPTGVKAQGFVLDLFQRPSKRGAGEALGKDPSLRNSGGLRELNFIKTQPSAQY